MLLIWFLMVKGKGAASDISGSMVTTSNHLERLERTPSISSGRSWVDPSVKVNFQMDSLNVFRYI